MVDVRLVDTNTRGEGVEEVVEKVDGTVEGVILEVTEVEEGEVMEGVEVEVGDETFEVVMVVEVEEKSNGDLKKWVEEEVNVEEIMSGEVVIDLDGVIHSDMVK